MICIDLRFDLRSEVKGAAELQVQAPNAAHPFALHLLTGCTAPSRDSATSLHVRSICISPQAAGAVDLRAESALESVVSPEACERVAEKEWLSDVHREQRCTLGTMWGIETQSE